MNENIIIWHSNKEESPDRTSQILVRIKRKDGEYDYHIWKFIKDCKNFRIPGTDEDVSEFYITQDRPNGLINVCLPGIGPNAYFEYQGELIDRRKVYVDYQWTYLE